MPRYFVSGTLSLAGCTSCTSRKTSVKFAFRRGLFGSHAPGGNVGLEVTFALHREPRQPPQHGELPHVVQRVRHRTLEQLLRRSVQHLIAFQILVKALQRAKKTLYFLRPGEWLRIFPRGLAPGYRKRPVKQVADVRQYLLRGAYFLWRLEFCEGFRDVAQHLPRPIGNRWQAMPQSIARACNFRKCP